MGISLGRGKCINKFPSGKAIKVRTKEHGTLIVPSSVVHDDSEVWKEGQEGNFVVKTWWAKKNGLTDEDTEDED